MIAVEAPQAQRGQLVRIRTRHWLVVDVSPSPLGSWLRLACVDDDAQGEVLEVIREVELDGQVLDSEVWASIGQKDRSLEAVKVRRLKEDVRVIAGGFPIQKVVQVDFAGLSAEAPELALAELLDVYASGRRQRFATPSKREQTQGPLPRGRVKDRHPLTGLSEARRHDPHFASARGSAPSVRHGTGHRNADWLGFHIETPTQTERCQIRTSPRQPADLVKINPSQVCLPPPSSKPSAPPTAPCQTRRSATFSRQV